MLVEHRADAELLCSFLPSSWLALVIQDFLFLDMIFFIHHKSGNCQWARKKIQISGIYRQDIFQIKLWIIWIFKLQNNICVYIYIYMYSYICLYMNTIVTFDADKQHWRGKSMRENTVRHIYNHRLCHDLQHKEMLFLMHFLMQICIHDDLHEAEERR